MFYQIESPRVTAFFHFPAVIPSFVKERPCALRQPGLRQFDKKRQRRKRPCCNDVWRANRSICVFDPPCMNPWRNAHFIQSGHQERRLFPIALNEMHLGARFFSQKNGHNGTGKSPTRSHVEPLERIGCETQQLGAVKNMTLPEIVQR